MIPKPFGMPLRTRMAHVRTYQLGPNSATSQRILNELGAAKACLSDPQKKAAYDSELREKLAQRQDVKSLPTADERVIGSNELPQEPGASQTPATRISQGAAVGRPARPSWQIPAAVGVVAVVLAGLIGFLVLGGNKKHAELAAFPDQAEPQHADKAPPPVTSPQAALSSNQPLPRQEDSNLPPPPPEPVGTATAPLTSALVPSGPPRFIAVNLLEKIDPTRDTIQGSWRFEGNALVSAHARPSPTLTIPYAQPADYSLTAVVERRDGNEHFGVGLVADSTTCVVRIDNKGISGINFIDGQKAERNETRFDGQSLDQGRQYTIECSVRKSSPGSVNITVQVDRRKIIDWTGASSRLSTSGVVGPHAAMKAGKDHFLWLQSEASSFAVSTLELRPVETEEQPATHGTVQTTQRAGTKKPHQPAAKKPSQPAAKKPSQPAAKWQMTGEFPLIAGVWRDGPPGAPGHPPTLVTISQFEGRITAHAVGHDRRVEKFGEIHWEMNGTISKDGHISGILTHTRFPPPAMCPWPGGWIVKQHRTGVLDESGTVVHGVLILMPIDKQKLAGAAGSSHEFTWRLEKRLPADSQ